MYLYLYYILYKNTSSNIEAIEYSLDEYIYTLDIYIYSKI